jgi:hypothetical protein
LKKRRAFFSGIQISVSTEAERLTLEESFKKEFKWLVEQTKIEFNEHVNQGDL